MPKFPMTVVSLEDGELPGVTGLSECERVARRPVAEGRDQDCGSVARAPAESFWHESSRVRVWEQEEGAGRMPCPLLPSLGHL